MVCIDDMCRGSGECFGDEGLSCFRECPECSGEGIEDDADLIDFLNGDWSAVPNA